MAYKPRSLFRLIQEINYSVFLPHIQRPFVWDLDQMRRLFDSLMRNYPVQTFLFWRTREAIKARRFMTSINWDADLHELYDRARSNDGVDKTFVLDGQQRLQTLFTIFNGSVTGPDGTSQLEAYIDLTSGQTITDDGLIYNLEFSAGPSQAPRYRLRDLLERDTRRNAEEVAENANDALDSMLAESEEDRKNRHKRVRKNCAQILSMLTEERHFWVQELDGVASSYPYKQILDIFVRVNSGGTKLDAGDLMFAAMKEEWADIEELVEEMVDLLNNNKLMFDKSFCLKCLVVTHGLGAELTPERFTSAAGAQALAAIRQDWPRAENAFRQLRDFIENELKLFSDKVVRTYGSFLPLFDYLYHNPHPDERNRGLMRAYYYKSQLFNWYGARTDAIINVMHGIVGKPQSDGFPMDAIKAYFSASRNQDVELRIDHLSDIRLRFIILNLLYVTRLGNSPFNVRYKGNEPHVDHIYPQSPLRSELGLDTSQINHLGNYRFFGATDNSRKRAEKPAEYFRRLRDSNVDIECHLLVPEYARNPSLLSFDHATYEEFRNRRLSSIFDISRRVVNAELSFAPDASLRPVDATA